MFREAGGEVNEVSSVDAHAKVAKLSKMLHSHPGDNRLGQGEAERPNERTSVARTHVHVTLIAVLQILTFCPIFVFLPSFCNKSIMQFLPTSRGLRFVLYSATP